MFSVDFNFGIGQRVKSGDVVGKVVGLMTYTSYKNVCSNEVLIEFEDGKDVWRQWHLESSVSEI